MAAKILEIQHFSEALHLRSGVPKGSKICLWWGNNFWEKSPHECVFFFFILHRSSRWLPKMGEKDFWEKSPVKSSDTLLVKNFVEIALSGTVSKINAFYVLHRNSRWLPKVVGKQFVRKSPVYSADTLWVKNLVEIALSCR